MTSTATCLESLSDCPSASVSGDVEWFAGEALKRKTDAEWQSEGSAGIYCRCRALPLVIQAAPSFSDVRPHLARILKQLEDTDRYAIGEADSLEKQQWYPPNAYHTYWALENFSHARKRFSSDKDFQEFEKLQDLDNRTNTMLLWAWHVLGCQVTLHRAKSAGLDTDQLIWSVAIVSRFRSRGTLAATTAVRYRDLLKEAIDTFFAAQEGGTWRHHGPLFHYREAGNAYCYIFESLAAVLKGALQDDNHLLRALLRPHVARLFALLEYAEATKEVMPGLRAFGWSSGHRTNMPHAESWATAAVFSCMEALRRLVGVWTREHALRDLGSKAPVDDTVKAIQTLVSRGTTWSEPAVAEQLITLFINPVLMAGANSHLDPDNQPISSRQARSAILFGPPGTSKTTLTRTIAAAIGWDFVELHPSHFVAAGLPNVQRTADEIFTKLMELDRCVILLDEIDELMRERDKEPDAFGRFLTTSMLPKLAELWKQSRVLYFVATNHVELFDRALTRSERFDALLLVPPPSFDVKKDEVLRILRSLASDLEFDFSVSRSEVDDALERIPKTDPKILGLDEKDLLAKFLLLRWDQSEELAHHLVQAARATNKTTFKIGPKELSSALQKIADSRLKEKNPYIELVGDKSRSTRDFSKDVVWKVDPAGAAVPVGLVSRIRKTGDTAWCVGTKDIIESANPGVTFLPSGIVRFA